MYSSTHLPPPLSPQMFYVLLGLARGSSHGYILKGIATSDSLRSVKMSDGTLYPLLKRMLQADLIARAGTGAGKHAGESRLYYQITPNGLDRLKYELMRLEHATKIGRHAGLMDDDIPLDIQKMLRELT